jgi:hypothetical protein
MEDELPKFAKPNVACRVVARAISVTRLKMSAFAKAPARQSTLFATLRAKTGGKGIRTPDLLIANETLYQLSYTPEVFRLPPFKRAEFGMRFNWGPPVLPPLMIFRQSTPVQKSQS